MAQDADTVSLRITLRYRDVDEFVHRYADNVSSAGLFLRTKAPKPAGTKVRFELLLVDGTRALRGEGVVVSVRTDDKPGMAIRFSSVDPTTQPLIDRIVSERGQGQLAPTPLTQSLVGTPTPPDRPKPKVTWRRSRVGQPGWSDSPGSASKPSTHASTSRSAATAGDTAAPRNPSAPRRPVPASTTSPHATTEATRRPATDRPWSASSTNRIRTNPLAPALGPDALGPDTSGVSALPSTEAGASGTPRHPAHSSGSMSSAESTLDADSVATLTGAAPIDEAVLSAAEASSAATSQQGEAQPSLAADIPSEVSDDPLPSADEVIARMMTESTPTADFQAPTLDFQASPDEHPVAVRTDDDPLGESVGASSSAAAQSDDAQSEANRPHLPSTSEEDAGVRARRSPFDGLPAVRRSPFDVRTPVGSRAEERGGVRSPFDGVQGGQNQRPSPFDEVSPTARWKDHRRSGSSSNPLNVAGPQLTPDAPLGSSATQEEAHGPLDARAERDAAALDAIAARSAREIAIDELDALAAQVSKGAPLSALTAESSNSLAVHEDPMEALAALESSTSRRKQSPAQDPLGVLAALESSTSGPAQAPAEDPLDALESLESLESRSSRIQHKVGPRIHWMTSSRRSRRAAWPGKARPILEPRRTRPKTHSILEPRRTRPKTHSIFEPHRTCSILARRNSRPSIHSVHAQRPKPRSVNALTPKPRSVSALTPKPCSVNAWPPKPRSVNALTPKPCSVNAWPPKPRSVNALTPKPCSVNAWPPKPRSVNSEAMLGERAASEAALGERADSEAMLGERVASEAALGERADSEAMLGERVASEAALGERADSEAMLGERAASEATLGERAASEAALGDHAAYEASLGTPSAHDSSAEATDQRGAEYKPVDLLDPRRAQFTPIDPLGSRAAHDAPLDPSPIASTDAETAPPFNTAPKTSLDGFKPLHEVGTEDFGPHEPPLDEFIAAPAELSAAVDAPLDALIAAPTEWSAGDETPLDGSQTAPATRNEVETADDVADGDKAPLDTSFEGKTPLDEAFIDAPALTKPDPAKDSIDDIVASLDEVLAEALREHTDEAEAPPPTHTSPLTTSLPELPALVDTKADKELGSTTDLPFVSIDPDPAPGLPPTADVLPPVEDSGDLPTSIGAEERSVFGRPVSDSGPLQTIIAAPFASGARLSPGSDDAADLIAENPLDGPIEAATADASGAPGADGPRTTMDPAGAIGRGRFEESSARAEMAGSVESPDTTNPFGLSSRSYDAFETEMARQRALSEIGLAPLGPDDTLEPGAYAKESVLPQTSSLDELFGPPGVLLEASSPLEPAEDSPLFEPAGPSLFGPDPEHPDTHLAAIVADSAPAPYEPPDPSTSGWTSPPPPPPMSQVPVLELTGDSNPFEALGQSLHDELAETSGPAYSAPQPPRRPSSITDGDDDLIDLDASSVDPNAFDDVDDDLDMMVKAERRATGNAANRPEFSPERMLPLWPKEADPEGADSMAPAEHARREPPRVKEDDREDLSRRLAQLGDALTQSTDLGQDDSLDISPLIGGLTGEQPDIVLADSADLPGHGPGHDSAPRTASLNLQANPGDRPAFTPEPPLSESTIAEPPPLLTGDLHEEGERAVNRASLHLAIEGEEEHSAPSPAAPAALPDIIMGRPLAAPPKDTFARSDERPFGALATPDAASPDAPAEAFAPPPAETNPLAALTNLPEIDSGPPLDELEAPANQGAVASEDVPVAPSEDIILESPTLDFQSEGEDSGDREAEATEDASPDEYLPKTEPMPPLKPVESDADFDSNTDVLEAALRPPTTSQEGSTKAAMKVTVTGLLKDDEDESADTDRPRAGHLPKPAFRPAKEQQPKSMTDGALFRPLAPPDTGDAGFGPAEAAPVVLKPALVADPPLEQDIAEALDVPSPPDVDAPETHAAPAGTADAENSDVAYDDDAPTAPHAASAEASPINTNVVGETKRASPNTATPVRAPTSRPTIALDIGGRWAKIGLHEAGEVTIVPAGGQAFIPALIAVQDDGRVAVGAAAHDIWLKDPSRTISLRSVLRAIDDRGLRQERTPPGVTMNDSEILVERAGHTFTVTDALYEFLAMVRIGVVEHLDSDSFQAVITVPHDLTSEARRYLQAGCIKAQIDVARIVTEPEAVVHAYGLDELPIDSALLVDLGSTHLALAVLRRRQGGLTVVKHRWLEEPCGYSIDQKVAQMTVEELAAQVGKDFRGDQLFKRRLIEASERARADIRRSPTVDLRVALPDAEESSAEQTIRLSRQQVYQQVEPLIAEACRHAQEILRDSGLDPRAVGAIAMAGSGGTFPPIVEGLQSLMLQEPIATTLPTHAYIVGGARIALLVAQQARASRPDTLQAAIGIELPGGRFRALAPTGSGLPLRLRRSYPTTRDNQGDIELKFYQGDGELVRSNTFIGAVGLRGFPKVLRGELTIELELHVDTDGVLTVSLCEPTSDLLNTMRVATQQTAEARRERLLKEDPPPRRGPKQAGKKRGFFSRLFGRD